MTKQPKGEEKFVLEEIVSILRDKVKKKISGLEEDPIAITASVVDQLEF